MELTQTLFGLLKESTIAYKEKNKNTSVIRFLDKAIKSIDSAVKGMDAFLKRKGVDIGKLYGDTVKGGKGLLDRAKEALGKDSEGKRRSLFKGLKEKGKDAVSQMAAKYRSFTTTGVEPPEGKITLDQEETQADKDKSVLEKTAGTFSSLVDKVGLLLEGIGKNTNTDANGDGVAEADWAEKFKSRSDKRKKEIEDEKKAVAERAKKKGGKDKGMLGWLGDKLLSLGGMITGGIWGATKFLGKHLLKGFGRAAWWLGGKVISGFSGLLTRFIPSLSGGIAKSLQGLMGNLLGKTTKLLGKGALEGAKMLGRSALQIGARALPFVARGAAMLLSGPVGWAVAAGTVIYGGYKLYKYMTRNDISDDIPGKMTRLRLLSYGFNDDNKESYSKVFDLEMLLKDNVSFSSSDFNVTIKKPDNDQIEKIYEIFGVSAEEKDKKTIVNDWFSKRFIPAFHAFMKAVKIANPAIYVDELDKLKPEDIRRFVSEYRLPPAAYDHKLIPFFENPTSTVTKESIETLLGSIKFDNKSGLKNSQLTPEEKFSRQLASERAKETADRAVSAGLVAANLKKAQTPPPTTIPMQYGVGSPDAEVKPDVPVTLRPMSGTGITSVTTAGGPLTPGDTSLPGVRTNLKGVNITSIDPNVLELFSGMAKEYHTLTGKTIQLNEGFRTREQQEALFRKYGSARAAPPGRSLHEFGLALDINSADTMELDKLGLLRKYGFTTTVGGEPWHIEPIGVSLNPELAKHDQEHRKNAIISSIGKGGGGFGLVQGGKKGGRDIALQRKIFESAVPEKEAPAMVAGGATPGASGPRPGAPQEGPVGVMAMSSPTSGFSSSPSTPTPPPLIAATSVNVARSSTPTPPTTSKGLVASGGNDIEPKPTSSTGAGGFMKTSAYGSSLGNNFAGSNLDLTRVGSMSPVDAIKQASAMTGVDEETLITFGKLESSLKAGAANSASSASGLFQITGKTWKELIGKHGPKYGIPLDADKNNPLFNSIMAAEYAKSNLTQLRGYKEAGIDEGIAVYLAHHFGPSGGNRIIKAMLTNPNMNVAEAVSTDAYRSNQSALRGHTVGSYLSSLTNKYQVAMNTPVEAYTPNTGGGYAGSVMASKPSEPTNTYASYTPTESIPIPQAKPSVAAYDVTRVESGPASSSNYQSASVTPSFDSSKMESIMNNQLTTLTQIATVLGAIHDKIDIEALGKAFSGGANTPNPPQPTIKEVPSTGVNMTRKSLVT